MTSQLYPLYTVRNQAGQFIATYRAKNAKAAINRLLADQAATAATFRKSQPTQLRADEFIAAIEIK